MIRNGHSAHAGPLHSAPTPLSGLSPKAYPDQLASSTIVAGGGAIGGGVVGSSLVRVEAGPLTVRKVPDLVPVR